MNLEIGGLIGLTVGIFFGLLGRWYGRKKAKQDRGLDEVHDYIWKTTRSISWYVTLFVIYIFFFLHVFGVEMGVAPILGILLLVHLGSWAFIGMVYTIKLQSRDD